VSVAGGDAGGNAASMPDVVGAAAGCGMVVGGGLPENRLPVPTP